MDTLKKDWIEFWKKFARMTQAGIPVLATLETIQKEANPLVIQETCRVLIEQLKKGNTIAGAMERLPGLFSPSMVTMLNVGEVTGKLETAMLSVAAGLEEGSFQPGSSETVVEAGKTETGDEAVTENDVPIITLVNKILWQAVKEKASDIHIESMPEKVRLRCRVDGALPELESPPTALGPAIINRLKILARMNVAEKRLPQDGRIQMNIANQPVDLRVSYVPIVGGESIVIRFLTVKSQVLTLEQIFKPDHLATMRRWLKRPQGLVIVSGPPGSGTTTTLYSLLKSFDATCNKIMTVEDPVEYRLEGVCQQQLNRAIGLTFPAALRVTLRQDPDIIMAGEIRDLETAQLLFHLAVTGHLGLTTFFAASGVTTAQRLVDLGLEPSMVNSIPVGIISQRLFRRICENCKEEIKPEPWMREFFPQGELPKLFKGKGCEQCHGTGYRGRAAVHELFEPSGEFIHKLARGASSADLQAEAVRAGLVTLRAEGLAKVAAGITTLEEVLRITSDIK